MYDPGKYDDACTVARFATKAQGVLLIVVNGEHGHGFSVQCPAELVPLIPATLRNVAAQIEQQNNTQGN